MYKRQVGVARLDFRRQVEVVGVQAVGVPRVAGRVFGQQVRLREGSYFVPLAEAVIRECVVVPVDAAEIGVHRIGGDDCPLLPLAFDGPGGGAVEPGFGECLKFAAGGAQRREDHRIDLTLPEEIRTGVAADRAVAAGIIVVVGHGVEFKALSELLQVRQAGDRPAAFAGPVQRRQKDSGENGDDRDNHKQFDEGEAAFVHDFLLFGLSE